MPNRTSPPARRGRPPKGQALTREIVLTTALQLAEEEFEGEINLRAIARRLGVTSMAIYNHVESKAEVELHLLKTLFARHFEPIEYDEATSGPEIVRRCNRSLFGVVQHHPKIFDIFIHNILAPEVLEFQEVLYEGLHRCGVPLAQQRAWARIFGSFIRGSVSWEFDQKASASVGLETRYSTLENDGFPRLTKAMAASHQREVTSFEHGLDILIERLQASRHSS